MVPALRATFSAALDQLDDALSTLRRQGSLSQPWLGDEISNETAAYYTHRAIDSPDSSFESLQQYRAELNRVHDILQQMETAYLRNETATSQTFRLQT